MQSTLRAIPAWLADERELGGPPTKVECTGEFDLHGYHYYIFKYKKNLLGKRLLGVYGGYETGETEHCEHVFSAIEAYNAKTALEGSIRMAEMIHAYWVRRTQEKQQERQTAPPYESKEIFPEQGQRKARSISILKEKGILYIEHLPVIESATTSRAPQEIAKRAIACLVIVQVACDISRGEGVKKSQEFFQQMLKTYGVADELIPKEQMFFSGKPSNQDVVNMAWEYEAYWPLIWTLGLIDSLEYPDQICDCDFAIEAVSSYGSFEELMESAQPREINEILDEAGLTSRYDWACANARLHSGEAPTRLNSGVIMECHWGLNQLIGKNSGNNKWDTVSTSI